MFKLEEKEDIQSVESPEKETNDQYLSHGGRSFALKLVTVTL